MIKLGFPEVWVDRVMKCVSTPSFSVGIDGKAYRNVIPSRGLRQGNPLSSFFFSFFLLSVQKVLPRSLLKSN